MTLGSRSSPDATTDRATYECIRVIRVADEAVQDVGRSCKTLRPRATRKNPRRQLDHRGRLSRCIAAMCVVRCTPWLRRISSNNRKATAITQKTLRRPSNAQHSPVSVQILSVLSSLSACRQRPIHVNVGRCLPRNKQSR